MSEREVIIIDPNAQAREQTLKDMRAYDKNPIDRAKKPGGYYLNADGSGAHDAEGKPVDLLPGDKTHAEELQRLAKARFGLAEETVAMDSPEEVADRAAPAGRANQPWTPAAGAAGTVLHDGSVVPDPAKKGKGK
jgi:hypothetical protein